LGRFLWNRFFANGGQEVLSEGEHQLKIEIRPYLKLTEVLTGNIIAERSNKIIVPVIKLMKNRLKFNRLNQLKIGRFQQRKLTLLKLKI
jgi:hypothetical protein